jgi:hypothetical protein
MIRDVLPMPQNRTPNQRQTPRRTAFIIAEYTVREGVFRDIIKNIGTSGMFISTKRPVAENQPVVLKFPLFEFDHLVQIQGKVVRSSHHGFAVTFDEPISGLTGEDGQFFEIVHEIDRKSSDAE